MKTLATEPSACFKALGPERGQAFISIIADFRAALFLDEVPSEPVLVRQHDAVCELSWPITADCNLLTSTEGVEEPDDWKNSYRIKFNSIHIGRSVLI